LILWNASHNKLEKLQLVIVELEEASILHRHPGDAVAFGQVERGEKYVPPEGSSPGEP
jgi:hypothetical protein